MAAKGTLDPDAPIVGPLISEVLIETPLGPMKLAAMSMESLSVAPAGKVNISGGPVTWPRCWLEVLIGGWHNWCSGPTSLFFFWGFL